MHDASTPNPLLVYLDALATDLRSLVPGAILQTDAEAIHQARVATRRLSAALDLLEPVVAPKRIKPFKKTLKQLRRVLGELRDADVLIDHLEEFAADNFAATWWLKDRLAAERKDHAEKAAKKSPVAKTVDKLGRWWVIHGEIIHLGDAMRSLLVSSLHEQLADFSSAAAMLANQPVDGSAPPAAVDPHAVRISGKAFRYTLEMAREADVHVDDAVFKHFKALQDHLGNWHDYVVLVDTLLAAANETMLAHHNPALMHDVLALATKVLGLSETQLAKFSRRWGQYCEEIAAAIRAAAPLSEDVAEPIVEETPSAGNTIGGDETAAAQD